MFTTETEDRVLAIKPMNCPGHVQIYNAALHSYRDLPIRYHDQSVLHRNEASGVLAGLTRARQFCQDDAHCFVTREQIGDEVERLLRPGGVHVVVDNDASRSTFGGWFARGFPDLPGPAEKRAFWETAGYHRVPVLTRWSFETRADLEAVVSIELPTPTAREVLADLPGTTLEVDYAVDVWWRRT